MAEARRARLAAALALGLTLLAGPALGQEEGRRDDARRPNIVLIIADDQHFGDFGFMGNAEVQTPNIDRLAAQSVRFVDGYVPTAACRPSLATLLTGLYPHQHGIHFNHPPEETYPARRSAERLIRDVATLPEWLAEVGYRSLQTGKFWEGHFSNAGFEQGMTLGEPAEIEAELGLALGHGNGDLGLAIGRRTMRPIVEFLDAPDPRPFLLWYAPFLPHVPHHPPDRYRDLYRGDPRIPSVLRRYYGNVSWLDGTVGRLLDLLEERELGASTLVVFLADNGWVPDPASPRHANARSKLSAHEAGVRTPILLRWPGRLRPREIATPISTVDLVPTLLDAAGSNDMAARLPGHDLLPALLAERPLAERPVFGEAYDKWATRLDQPERQVTHRWVRHGRHKLIVPRDPSARPQLFDLALDPHERHDLGRRLDQTARIEALRRQLDRWWPLPAPATDPLTVPLGMATTPWCHAGRPLGSRLTSGPNRCASTSPS